MKRAALLVVVLLAVVAAVVFFVMTILAEPAGPADVAGPGTPSAGNEGADETRPLASEPVSDTEERRRRLRFPWPFADFAFDIANAREPGRRAVYYKRQAIELEHFRIMATQKVTIRLENVRVPEVVAELAPQFEPLGLRVYTRDPPVPDQIIFPRVYLTDVTVQDVIAALQVLSDDLVDYAVTPDGLCIGSYPACQEARTVALDWEARQRTELDAPDDDSFLDVSYRPDFSNAHIGAVIEDILAKTGVQVIADENAWGTPIAISWRTDPLPLRVALRGIAQELGVSLIARGKRAFLLGR